MPGFPKLPTVPGLLGSGFLLPFVPVRRRRLKGARSPEASAGLHSYWCCQQSQKPRVPVGLRRNLAGLGGGLGFFVGFTLVFFSRGADQRRGPYLLSPPGRWAASPCLPQNRTEQGPREIHPPPSRALGVYPSASTYLLLLLPPSPFPPDAVLCLQTQCAGWWETNHKLTFGALRCLGRAVNSKRAQKTLVRILSSTDSKCLRDGVNPKRMAALFNDFATPESLHASVKH